MTKRKTITKKKRFEIFKRDGFVCAYCGNSPPSTVLEIDHIIPVSKGGGDDYDNLVTSCFDCNRGKGAKELTSIPLSLSIKAEKKAEMEEQLKEYNKLLRMIKSRKTRDINKIEKIFKETFENHKFTNNFKEVSVSSFIDKLPFEDVAFAMKKACSYIDNNEQAVKYFCGICWNKIKEGRNE